jgi:hypothetical protein
MFGFLRVSDHHQPRGLLPGRSPPGRADEQSVHTFAPRNIVMAIRFHIGITGDGIAVLHDKY